MIEHMYQYSLDSFVSFLYKAIDKTPPAETTDERSDLLIDYIRMVIFRWVNRGLFERHKLILCSILAFRLLARGKLEEEYNATEFNFLLRGPMKTDVENPLKEWLPNANWFSVQALIDVPGFENFAQQMEKDAPNRFKEWFNELAPEEVKLPLDWKRLDNEPLRKLLVLRALRPDRMTIALSSWIRGALPNGKEYMDCDASSSFFEVLSSSFDDSNNMTPIFFVLSPGADPVKEVERLGNVVLSSFKINVNYFNVAMGQGTSTRSAVFLPTWDWNFGEKRFTPLVISFADFFKLINY
jgi:dynein heavy chain